MEKKLYPILTFLMQPISISLEFDVILKVSLQETSSIIFKSTIYT